MPAHDDLPIGNATRVLPGDSKEIDVGVETGHLGNSPCPRHCNQVAGYGGPGKPTAKLAKSTS